jgi:glucose uptake protein GlcU
MNWTEPYTVIGIIGMLFILFGIWRTSTGRWTDKSVLYELDTIIGASLLIVYQLHYKAYVSLPIHLLVVFIAFRGLSSFAERYAKKEIAQKRKKKNT